MAQKRMFSLQVIDTDRFMDMPSSSQALYFHLGMHGDDDGFVSAPKKITRAAGCSDDDLRLLAQKGYIIPFDSGVIVITDWKLNNSIKGDRYHETVHQTEKAMLKKDSAGRYLIGANMEPVCFQSGTDAEPESSLDLDKTTSTLDHTEVQRMSRQTPQQKREKALLGAIGKHTAELGLYRECDIAQYVGMSPQSWGKYRAKNFQIHGLLVFSLIARRLGFTGREVCAIVGVSYEDTGE